ncbi:MAG: hypothetical protein AAGF99_11340 [Bacteroidota bacterium]
MRALALPLLFATLTGCGTLLPTPQPPVTQTATASANSFDCALSTLTDLDYTIVDAERNVFIRAERRDVGASIFRERFVHILTTAEVDGVLRVTSDREVFGRGDDRVVYREPYGPDRTTLGDAEAVLAACTATP